MTDDPPGSEPNDRDRENDRDPDPVGDDRDPNPAWDDRDPERTWDDREEWGRIPIDVADDADESAARGAEGGEDEEHDPYAPEPSSTPIVADDPSLEGMVFVFLGALAMVLVMVRLASILVG